MASYLATASLGNVELREYTAPNGLPILDAVDRDVVADPGPMGPFARAVYDRDAALCAWRSATRPFRRVAAHDGQADQLVSRTAGAALGCAAR